MTSDRIRLLQLKWHKESLSIHAASEARITFGPDEKGQAQGQSGQAQGQSGQAGGQSGQAGGQSGQARQPAPAYVLAALRSALAKGKFKGKQTFAALPNHLVTTVPIKFSLKEGEGTDQAILREAHNYLPFPQEQGGTISNHFVIDYLDLSRRPLLPGHCRDPYLKSGDFPIPSDQRPQQTKAQPLSALLIAARTEDVLRYLDLFKKAGLSLSVIEPRYCSLFRTIQWTQQFEPLKDQFIFSMEENDTLFMVLVDEQILIVRTLSWGINAFLPFCFRLGLCLHIACQVFLIHIALITLYWV